jgi:hypothetical protein
VYKTNQNFLRFNIVTNLFMTDISILQTIIRRSNYLQVIRMLAEGILVKLLDEEGILEIFLQFFSKKETRNVRKNLPKPPLHELNDTFSVLN